MSRAILLPLAALALLPSAARVGAQPHSPAGPVPVELLEARRQALLSALAGRPALVGSSRQRELSPGQYPQDSDYRESNDYFYLTGLETPGGWLAFNLPEPGAVTLFLPPRDAAAEAWTGPRLGPGAEAAALSGIPAVRAAADLETGLARWLPSPGGSGDGLPLLLSAGHPDSEAEVAGWLRGSHGDVGSLGPTLAALRLVKDDEEIRRLRRAVEITMEGQREAWRVARAGAWEYELEAALEYVFRASGAERLGFPSIVGSGPNTVILHYDRNRRRIQDGDLVLIDVGAEFGYYTADVTRTIPASGRFTPRQRAVYDLVLGAQEAALAVLRPGVTVGQLNAAAREHLDRSSGDVCGGMSCSRFFVHGLSHWLGMDVHDVGSYETPLRAGMVLTVEPGIYLANEALGIRIEDVVLVTEGGYELLTADLPRDPPGIEALMAEDPAWVRPR